jgi:hypothetical protein
MHSSKKLAEELRKAGLDAMAEQAEEGYYHDFLSPLDTPCVQLEKDLRAIGTPEAEALRQRHLQGEFDATPEESEEWAKGPDGQEAMGRLREKHPLGDAPVEPKLVDMMNSVAFALDQILNGPEVAADPGKRVNGFVLMIFPYGDQSGRCNYISNGANREDIARLFEEQARRFKEPPPP